MRLSADRIKRLCTRRHLSLQAFLESAGVSRTAYYSLVRRPSLLPRSVQAMARALGVDPSALVEEASHEALRSQALLARAREVLQRHPEAAFENVWHTLVLLDMPPIERLRRSLLRGRAADIR